jgi:uncharacterized membrane protein YhaH (DUF805 family)
MLTSIDTGRVGRVLVAIVLVFNVVAFGVLAAADVLGGEDGELARQFDVAEEGNFTAWFGVTLLLLAVGVLVCASLVARSREDRDTRSWWLLTAGFVYLSLDEAAGLHELLIDPVGDATDASGAFHYAWIVVAIPAMAIAGVMLLGFLRRLPRATRTSFLIAGAVFLGGAVGVEALEGVVLDADLAAHGVQRLMVTLEELLENLGVVLFVAAVLRHLVALDVRSLTVELR